MRFRLQLLALLASVSQRLRVMDSKRQAFWLVRDNDHDYGLCLSDKKQSDQANIHRHVDGVADLCAVYIDVFPIHICLPLNTSCIHVF